MITEINNNTSPFIIQINKITKKLFNSTVKIQDYLCHQLSNRRILHDTWCTLKLISCFLFPSHAWQWHLQYDFLWHYLLYWVLKFFHFFSSLYFLNNSFVTGVPINDFCPSITKNSLNNSQLEWLSGQLLFSNFQFEVVPYSISENIISHNSLYMCSITIS